MTERPVECHLGDVIGELPPMRPIIRRPYPGPQWVERTKHTVIATVGVTGWAILLVCLVVSLFYAAKPALMD